MSLLRIKLDKGGVKEFRVLQDRFKEWKGFEKLREPEKSNKAGGE
jgi:hypothetical protein